MKSRLLQTFSQWLKPGVSANRLVVGSAIVFMSVATVNIHALAETTNIAQVTSQPQAQLAQSATTRKLALIRLPAQVKNAVFRVYARQVGVPVNKLRVVSFSRETWSDNCFGLGGLAESCGVALVNGWRVEVGQGDSGQFYRTDNTGRAVRLEEINNIGTLPQGVGQKVLAIASKELKIPVSQLKIAAGRSRLWDGCLGIAGPNEACTMIGIPGWQVIVAGQQQYWVYHIDRSVTKIKRNPTTSGKGNVVPTFWEPDPSMAPPNTGEIVFQSIKSGGIAGRAYKTLLYQDGQILQIDLSQQLPKVPTLVRQITPQQVQEFTNLLQQNEFGDFLGFNYSPTAGADYFTIALMSPWTGRGAQYVDIVQGETPVKLQQIIQAWNRISSPGSR